MSSLPKPSAGRGVFVQKQKSNVYTVLLGLSLLALLIGCLFLYWETGNYERQIHVPGDAKASSVQAPQPAAPAPGNAMLDRPLSIHTSLAS